jgi:transposase
MSLPKGAEPEIIGVDDWAWRKGHRSGTIIVDLERGCPIDVLEDRAAETVATWLHAHPNVQIVARDRAEAYAAGIRQGAPAAMQVADRFHLLKNLAAALQIVAAYVSRLRPPQGRITRHRRSGAPTTIVAVDKPLTPSRATWLIMRREATLNEDEKHQRARLHSQEGAIAEAITLTQDFATLVRQRQPGQLATWLERATASGLQAFKSFAHGLRADDAAVKAGLTLPWSTGPVEGQINRLKMLKRQMYGRAHMALLRQRVLLPT